MYLRRHNKKADGEHYDYRPLVESIRTVSGPRQRIVATTGKLPGLDKEKLVGREEIRRILEGKPIPQPDIFQEHRGPPSWATVNINEVSVERLRHFGDIYLGLPLWNKPGFAGFRADHMEEGKEDINWSVTASILARFCTPSSELPNHGMIKQPWMISPVPPADDRPYSAS
jgi:hypothetical protein